MKKFLLLWLFACLALVAKAQTTLFTSVTGTSFCADSVQVVPVTFSDAVATYQPGNIFSAEISDAQGNFTNPAPLGQLISSSSSGTIQAVLPSYLLSGNNYRIRVVASNPATIGQDNGANLSISPVPQIWVTTPTAFVCNGGVTQLSATGNVTNYSWSPSAGLSSSTGATVMASPTASTMYTVNGTNTCGTSAATAFVNVDVFQTLFKETMGNVAFTTLIPFHESNNGFDNNHLYFSGTGDVRNSLPSSGYAGASGGANIYLNFNNPVNPDYAFEIHDINTFGMTNLELSFGVRKNTTSSTGSELAVEASVDNGASWTLIGSPVLPSGSGTNSIWHYVTVPGGAIPAAQDLAIRFRQTASTVQFRIDDVLLRNPWQAPTITTSGPTGPCGGTVILTASGGNSYSWSTGATTQAITVTQNGSYTVSVTDANNCVFTSDPVVFSNFLPTPVATNNGPLCIGQTLQLSANGDPTLPYTWTGPNNFSSYSQNPSIVNISAAEAGSYTVTTSIPGCGTVSAYTTAVIAPATFTPAITSSTPICEGQTLVLTMNTIPGATYTWTGPNGFTSSAQSPVLANASAAQSGLYTVVVNTACGTATNTHQVTINPQPVAPVPTSNSPLCPGSTISLSATGTPAGATYSWSGPMGFSAITQNPVIPNATNSNSGTYFVWVIVNGCTSPAGLVQVSVQAPPPVIIHSNLPVCPGSSLTLTAMGGTPGQYSWSGPNNFSANANLALLPNLQPVNYGTYTVSSGSGNCTSTSTITVGAPAGPPAFSNTPVCPGDTIFLTADSSSFPTGGYSWVGPNGFTSTLQYPTVPNVTAAHSGAYSVYNVLSNCVSSPTVIQVDVTNNLTVAASNNGPINQGGTLILTASGSAGNYTWTGPNNYQAYGTNPYIQQVTPANAGNYTATLSSAGCSTVTAITSVVVNPMNQITGVVFHDLNNNGVQNAGESPMPGMLVMVQPGNYTAITNSSGTYTAYVPDGTYTVTVAGLAAYQTASPGSISVTVAGSNQISTGHNFGVHSTSVNNLYISITEVWNAAPGFTTFHRITYKNLGNALMSGTVRYLPDPALSINSNTSSGYTMAADTLVWSFSNLQPNQTAYKYVYATVPVGTVLGTVLTSTAKVTPITGDVAPANNVFTLTQTVVGSWDPNDKAVQPAGPITVQDIAAGQDLVYTIRFQNTGTAPAVNVLVMDTLSDNLDLSTFQMLSSSHNYVLTMHESGIAEWRFNNIMLPDSNSNEPASHGDIQYRIKPKSSLVVGDNIFNTAHIFFDFNEAIVTNTTHTPVGITATPDVFEASALNLFPNPTTGSFTLQLSKVQPGQVQVRVLNLLGQEVYQNSASATRTSFKHKVQLQQLPEGIYLLQVQQGRQSLTKRVVLQH